jgi:hypothetical protein
MVFWDDLGFDTNYTVDVDIEYPGDGQWGMPVVELISGPTLPTPAPVATIRSAHGREWVLSAGFTGIGDIFGSPDPDSFCVVERYGRVIWMNAETLDQRDQGRFDPVHVAAAADYGLLLLAGPNSIAAIGTDGVRWTASNLVAEDLHITRSDGRWVYYRGLGFNSVDEIRGSLDVRTGTIIPN